MSLSDVLGVQAAAANALREAFDAPWRAEAAGDYTLDVRRADVGWLKEQGPGLIAALLPAGYAIRLTVQVQRWKVVFTELRAAGPAFGEVYVAPDQQEPTVDFLALMSPSPVRWDDLVGALEPLHADPEAGLHITLGISLNTKRIAEEIAGLAGAAHTRVSAWVFPERLAAVLEQEPVKRLAEHVDPDRRTVILVTGMQGVLSGGHIAIAGAKPAAGTDPATHAAGVAALLASVSPLTQPDQEGVTPAKRARAFRTAQKSQWEPYTSQLTPPMLSVEGETSHPEVAAALLQIRSLLSLAYVANGVRFTEGERFPMTMSFVGEEGGRELAVTKEAIPTEPGPHRAAFDLYAFAYEAESGVPIEIARRLTARMADEPALLFTRLDAILAASEDVHAGYLGDEVTKYFETLQKAETYLLRATRETEAAAVELTRSAGELLFKTLGVVAGAVIAAAFEPDIENVAGIVASVTIGCYVALTLRYYAFTLRDSAANLKLRHAENLETFRKVLPRTVAGLLTTARVDDAWQRYAGERVVAVRWLALLLVGAASAFAFFVLRAIG